MGTGNSRQQLTPPVTTPEQIQQAQQQQAHSNPSSPYGPGPSPLLASSQIGPQYQNAQQQPSQQQYYAAQRHPGPIPQGGPGDGYRGRTASSAAASLIPTVFKWTHGGRRVYVTGTFNQWQTRIPLSRSGEDFIAILQLPSGVHQYKFIVDDEWRTDPSAPTTSDAAGNINNLLQVELMSRIMDSDSDGNLAKNGPGGNSSMSSNSALFASMADGFGQVEETFEENKKNPPLLPPHLVFTPLNRIKQQQQQQSQSQSLSASSTPSAPAPAQSSGPSGLSSALAAAASSSSSSAPLSPSLTPFLPATYQHPFAGGSILDSGPMIVGTPQAPSNFSGFVSSSSSAASAPQSSAMGGPLSPSSASSVSSSYIPISASSVSIPLRSKQDPALLPVPLHVTLNHMYFSKRDSVLALGITQRYKQKFATIVLYKPCDILSGTAVVDASSSSSSSVSSASVSSPSDSSSVSLSSPAPSIAEDSSLMPAESPQMETVAEESLVDEMPSKVGNHANHNHNRSNSMDESA